MVEINEYLPLLAPGLYSCCFFPFHLTVLSGPEERGLTVPAWIVLSFHDSGQSRSYFSIRRLRVTSAKLVVCTRSKMILHTHATHAGVGEAAEMFRPVKVKSFRIQQCRRRSRLRSKRCVMKPFLTHFSSLESFLFLDEILAWPFCSKPFFGTPTILYFHISCSSLLRFCVAFYNLKSVIAIRKLSASLFLAPSSLSACRLTRVEINKRRGAI